ncbi:MAG: DAK2 domain-containing protein [Lachnospiraceae bacterium]|nr:DAK2 domain-containing protein [Lachnospiraceae bacterium]
MANQIMDTKTLKKLFLAGASRLEARKEYVNELNVFPVPDGDTGSNMSMTIMAAAKEVAALPDDCTMKQLCKAISGGSLRGARGNSGVILSQLLRGFTKEISEKNELRAEDFYKAFQRAVETAYKAVMKPKEGTILTVAKGMADKTKELAKKEKDLTKFFQMVIEEGFLVLNRTPDMLPVLKEAGVVDSGGQGLMEVLSGALDAYLGKEVEITVPKVEKKAVSGQTKPLEPVDIKFGYCTEFIIMTEEEFTEEMEDEFKAFLTSIGDSIVVVASDGIVKVHVHTNHPGLAIEKALTHGALTSMKIDNMREEHEERLIKDASRIAKEQDEEKQSKAEAQRKAEPAKEMAFIAVSIGQGINEVFEGLGVDYLIEGGQTMNPSTEDMLEAIEKVNAKTIFILPNNKNIILAANQARDLTEDKKIVVVPTKTIPQGVAALIAYMGENTPEENEANMLEAIGEVKTGQVTYAVRDTSMDGKEIHTGDMMGIGDSGILAVNPDLEKTLLELLDALTDEDSEVISLYYGDEVEGAQAEEMAAKIEDLYPDCDVELQYGGQPIYYYIVSVE